MLKEIGCLRVSRHAADEPWRAAVRGIIAALAAKGQEITTDDVRTEAQRMQLPAPHHPNCWGAAMKSAAAEGLIGKTGAYRKSTFDSRHSGLLAVWR
jgi:hypothetical protein